MKDSSATLANSRSEQIWFNECSIPSARKKVISGMPILGQTAFKDRSGQIGK
jgi:hypothetical protein